MWLAWLIVALVGVSWFATALLLVLRIHDRGTIDRLQSLVGDLHEELSDADDASARYLERLNRA